MRPRSTSQGLGGGAFVVSCEMCLRNPTDLCNALVMHNAGTAKDKAAELGISRSTLTRRVKSGNITPAFRAEGENGITLFFPESPSASAFNAGVEGVSLSAETAT